MLKIYLLWPGKTKEPWLRQGIEYYIKRLKNYYQVNVIETRAAKQKNAQKEQLIKKEEAYITDAIKKLKGQLIILDIKGAELNSTELAKFIEAKQNYGVTSLIFVIGGAYGLSENFLKKADFKLSLSKLTFTHEMSRLILIEQLYRAASIIKGSPYHH